jgi:hypothetical protein
MKISANRTLFWIILPIELFIVFGCDNLQKQPPPSFTERDKQEILNLLDRQALDWSQGDLRKFMEGYWKSDSLQFIGKSGIRFGWQNTMDNYQKNFPDTVAMGKLRFEILKINPVRGDAAYLTGKFFLKRTIGNLDGIFTLVFRKIDGRWLCVYDHTSQ